MICHWLLYIEKKEEWEGEERQFDGEGEQEIGGWECFYDMSLTVL